MDNHRFLTSYLSALLVSLALAGCASAPNSNLESAHSELSAVQGDPQIVTFAGSELADADAALKKADEAWQKDGDKEQVDHLAYVAKQKISIARETANQKAAEQRVAQASNERRDALIDARTREADSLRQRSEAAERQAQAAEVRASQIEADLRELHAMQTNRGLVVTLGSVLFETDKAEFKPGAMRNLQKLANALNKHPERKVLIEGFTDSTGSDGYNRDLSERRADAVRRALTDLGISSERVESRGYGKEFPVATNDTAEGRQLNRRVEIIISDENGNIESRQGT